MLTRTFFSRSTLFLRDWSPNRTVSL